MYLSRLFYVFLALCQTKPSWSLTKIQSLLKLLHWTKGVEWVKVRNALGPLCLWQCFLRIYRSRDPINMSPHLRRRKTHCVGWEQLLSSVLACWWSQRCWVRASLLPGLGASPPFPPSIPPPWIVYVCHWVFVSLFVLCACDFECVGRWGRVGVSVPVCVCVPVCACMGVCQCGLGAEVTASCPPPLSLPLHSTII